MASILFIAPARLDETVLATGALDRALAEAPGAEVVTVCGEDVAPILRAVPGLTEMHFIEADATPVDWAGLWRTLAGRRFDIALNGRGPLFPRTLQVERLIEPSRAKFLRHLVEDWSAAFESEAPLAPTLWLDGATLDAPSGAFLAIGSGADDASARWPAENYAAVARRLSGAGPLADAHIIVLGKDRDLTRAITLSLETDGVPARDFGGAHDPLAVAALLARATLYIGEDIALTPIAAAVGAPTLGLYGPADERVRGPYGSRARTLRGRDYEEIMARTHAGLDETGWMDDVSVDAVEAAASDLLRAGGFA